jgi:hypothetical protein
MVGNLGEEVSIELSKYWILYKTFLLIEESPYNLFDILYIQKRDDPKAVPKCV